MAPLSLGAPQVAASRVTQRAHPCEKPISIHYCQPSDPESSDDSSSIGIQQSMAAGKKSSKKNRFRHREKSAKLGLLFRVFSAPRLFSQPLLTEIGDARGQDASMMTRLASAPRGQGSREAPRRWRDAGRVVICVVGDLGRRCCRPRSSDDVLAARDRAPGSFEVGLRA